MFKVGDNVMIRPDSKFYGMGHSNNPANVVGVVRLIDESGFFIPTVYVDWPSGDNSYRISDLIFAEELKIEDFV